MRPGFLKGILGIFLMALFGIGGILYVNYGSAITAKTVLTASSDIAEGTVIDNPDKFFKAVKIDETAVIKGALTENELMKIKGKAAKQFIPNNGQVTESFFDKPGVVVSDKEFVFKIPSSWIYVVPSSIRSGDDISFYEVDSNIESNIGKITQESDNSLAVYEQTIRVGNKEPVLLSTVKYVKDSTNREVVDTEGPRRFDGSSQVSSIEIVCTQEEMKILEQKVIDGMKFIIVYR